MHLRRIAPGPLLQRVTLGAVQRDPDQGRGQDGEFFGRDEVREVVGDLRLSWPDGSPRFAAERLVPSLGGDERAAEALRGLAAASERALFDRSENYDLPGTWADEVAAVTAALTAQARAQAQSHQRRNARPRRAARS